MPVQLSIVDRHVRQTRAANTVELFTERFGLAKCGDGGGLWRRNVQSWDRTRLIFVSV
jgi:hypothetical protein